MKHFLAITLFLSIAQNIFSQSVVRNMMHDGIQRSYRVYEPAIYDGSEAVPLIINLHGYTSNAFEQEVYGDFRPIADTANFILIHPDGTLDASGTTFWNAFGSPSETVDDIGFISALIDTIASDFNIDLNRVYSTGMSNGGFMSYRLACELSHRITAIASVTGAMLNPAFISCNPVHPTPIMEVHGTADPTVPYLGSGGVLGVEAGIAHWVDFNNCNMTAVQTAIPNVDLTDGCTADHFVYSGGDAGSSVELYRTNGGGHTWPGSNPLISIGVTNRDFSASKEIWRFFSQYSLDGLVGIDEQQSENPLVVYPNPSNGNVALRFENAEKRTIQVHNATGQLVKQTNFNGSSFEFELESSGVYFLTVISEKETFTQKLIVN
ncbi:MAG: T9SS type A sorting domain-containing protein [Flavobacteriales bacterium]|nr:T9SS type A sorting domain-containing protein [Flavobacteriales bacterium]